MGKQTTDASWVKSSLFITYIDANNLYGSAMSERLPTHGIKWMSELKDWKDTPCILEVGLFYPDELHDLHTTH